MSSHCHLRVDVATTSSAVPPSAHSYTSGKSDAPSISMYMYHGMKASAHFLLLVSSGISALVATMQITILG